jgi:hypothetical protein
MLCFSRGCLEFESHATVEKPLLMKSSICYSLVRENSYVNAERQWQEVGAEKSSDKRCTIFSFFLRKKRKTPTIHTNSHYHLFASLTFKWENFLDATVQKSGRKGIFIFPPLAIFERVNALFFLTWSLNSFINTQRLNC